MLTVRLLDRPVVGEEPLRVVKIFLCAFDFNYIYKCKNTASLEMIRN
jgi:hypothetical protein